VRVSWVVPKSEVEEQGEDGKAREAFAQAKALDPQGTAGAEAAKMMKQLR